MTIPLTLGKYDILKTLGRGGMGTVYLGYDKKLHRHVAIKTILRDELGGEDMPSEYAQRFELEAKAIAKLNHPNIVGVYDSGEEGDTAYIVMEFIEGNDLKYYFDNQISFNLSEALRLMVDLLEALAHAHDKGVWHRDIKPANVMIDTTGQLKLTDFGVSRIADTSERSRTGTMVGTLHYMSPEQVLNTGVSHRSDLFAAAVILYQFLTQTRPFTGSEYEISHKIVKEDALPPSQLNPSLPPQLDAVLAKAMAKQPEQRYANAREFIAAIKNAVGERQEPLLDVDATRHFYASHGSKNTTTLEPVSGRRSASKSNQAGSKATTPGVDLSLTSPSENAEIEFWRSIKDGNDVDEFSLYLTRFPNGTYAALARKRIEKYAEGSGVSTPASAHSGITGATAATGGSGHSGAMRPGHPEKKEPVFGDFADASGIRQAPAPAAAAPRREWQLPAAIVTAAALIAAGLWFTRAQPPANATGVGIITPAPASTQPVPPAPAAPTQALPAPASSQGVTATAPPASAQVPVAPAAAASNASAQAPAAPGIDKAAEKLAEKQRQDEARRAREMKELALQEKAKREEAAASKAREAIAAANNDGAKPATESSKAGANSKSSHQCLQVANMSVNTAGKTEAELCSAAKTRANAWIAQWKTPGGIAKGQDKFTNPEVGECKCQSGSCGAEIRYSGPCE